METGHQNIPEEPTMSMNPATPARTSAEQKLWAALRAHPRHSARDLASYAKIGKSTATKALSRWETGGHVTRHDNTATGPNAPNIWTVTEPDTVPGQHGQRLRRGELRALVAAFLRDPGNRGHPRTAGETARALGRSAGAVSNALDRLTGDGTVVQVSSRPHRYSATPCDT